MQEMNTESMIRNVSLPLYNAKFWMKLIGVVTIIYGVLTALSIVGLIIAWLPIWLGVLLFQAANAVEHAYQAGDQESMARSLEKLKLFFIINGVVLLIMLILGIIGFLFFGSMIGGMMAQYGGGMMF